MVKRPGTLFSAGRVPVELRWNTASGQNYDLFTSPDMKEWSHVEGFPQTGSGGLMAHTFTTGQRGFFRIIPTAAPTGEFVYLPAGEFQMGNTKLPRACGIGSARGQALMATPISLRAGARDRTILSIQSPGMTW